MLSPVSDPAVAMRSQFRWYLGGVVAWFAAFGLQSVLVTYLLTTVLHAPASLIGFAQGVINLPAVFLLLVGGAVADHVDNRRLMLGLHLAASVPAFALAVVVATGALTYEWIIAYGLAIGTVTPFLMPAREALLARVTPGGPQAIQRAVTTMVGTQFVAQMMGFAFTVPAVALGVAPLLVLQGLIQLFGAFAASRLHPAPPLTRAGTSHSVEAHIARIAGGLVEVARSPALLPVIIVAFGIGMLFVGSFMVILPVIMREEYGGDVTQFALLQLAFWGGSIISSMSIARFGTVVRRGRLVTMGLVSGVAVLIAFYWPAPMAVFYALVFAWGLGAGVVISMARTVVQENAPPGHLARVLSVYQLGFTGGMPIGAIALGLVVNEIGARASALVPAFAMLAVVGALLLRTELWRIKASDRMAPQAHAQPSAELRDRIAD